MKLYAVLMMTVAARVAWGADGGVSNAPALAAQTQGGSVSNAPAGAAKEAKAAAKKAKVAAAGRESVITAKKIEFDNSEGVILFDENVFVDDEQFLMHADRLLVFLEGTNDVQQLMAIGRVSITNENRTALCDKAVFTKKDWQIVMTGNARLIQKGGESGEITGDRIVIWVDGQRMEVYPGRVVLPPGTLNKGDHKLLP